MGRGAYHLVAATDKNGNSARVGALLDDEHPILGRAEANLTHHARLTELLRCDLREPGNDAATGGDGDQLCSKQMSVSGQWGLKIQAHSSPKE